MRLENSRFSSNFVLRLLGQWSVIVIFILQKYAISS
jgi:hypothetical protein